MINTICQTETYQVAPGKDETHGYGGPLKVSYGGAFSNIGQEFLDVGAKYDTVRGSLEDPNGLFNINGYGVRVIFIFVGYFLFYPVLTRPISSFSRGGKSTQFFTSGLRLLWVLRN